VRHFFPLMLSVLLPSGILAQTSFPAQKFVCNTGYTLQRCDREMNVLRPILKKFHADELGAWTWILVRSEDWRSLLDRLGADHDSPSLTFLRDKATLFEEALLEPLPARRAELLKTWQIPLDQLLVEAVSHEIGHSMCNDPDEARAERRARALQRGETPTCGGDRQGRPGVQTAAVLQPSASSPSAGLRVKRDKPAATNLPIQ
jgi:hypothetical protein